MSRIRKRDWRFIVLVLVHALCIAGFIRSGMEVAPPETGGWRRIDVEAVRAKIREGDLVDREADWYRVLPRSGGEPR